jgi:hypothetical protein
MFDFDWVTPHEPWNDPIFDDICIDDEFVLLYVPEAEFLEWSEACLFARERDYEAAQRLEGDFING